MACTELVVLLSVSEWYVVNEGLDAWPAFVVYDMKQERICKAQLVGRLLTVTRASSDEQTAR